MNAQSHIAKIADEFHMDVAAALEDVANASTAGVRNDADRRRRLGYERDGGSRDGDENLSP